MKVRIEILPEEQLKEMEVVIYCNEIDAEVLGIQQFVSMQQKAATTMAFIKDDQEYYFPVSEVLFFETADNNVYAHTANDVFRVKYRLYEVEEMVPAYFVRISKSAIINSRKIYSIARNIASASLVQFQNSHKEVYVSRHYYKVLKQKLAERS